MERILKIFHIVKAKLDNLEDIIKEEDL